MQVWRILRLLQRVATVENVIGSLLALVVIATTMLVGIGRGRNFYPILLIIVPSYYVLFAVMLGSGRTVLIESVVAAAFILAGLLASGPISGSSRSLW
jgi:hypothetical protein